MQNFYLSETKIKDNIQFFKENSEQGYVDCIQKIIRQKPFGDNKFYIFSFVKRVDDDSGVKVMYHQPRLTRPEPLPGTTLMKVDPRDPDEARIIWTLPNQENFGLYKYKKMFSDPFVWECIEKFKDNPKQFMRPDPEDLSEDEIFQIYKCMKKGSSIS